MKQLLQIVSIILFFGGVTIAQPTVISVSPVRNAIDISKTSNIVINFSETMDALGAIQPNAVTVRGSMGGKYTTQKSLSGFNDVLTIDPDSSFIPGEIITVFISAILNDENNGAIDRFSYQFRVKNDGIGEGYFSSSDTFTGSIGDNGANMTYMGDLDADGDADAIVLTRTTSDLKFYVLYKQDGTDSYLTPSAFNTYDVFDTANPQGATLNDIDGDGDLDFIIFINPGANTRSFLIYTNNGSGSFTSHSHGLHSNLPTTSIGGGVFADVTRNDINELFILADNVYGMWPFSNSGGGTPTAFTEATGVGQYSSIAGRYAVSRDFNNDDYPDFAIVKKINFSATPTNDSLGVLLSDGAGGYTSATYNVGSPSSQTKGAWGMDAGDFDGDGYVDLAIVTNDSLYILDNNQDGTFADERGFSRNFASGDLKAADMDNDGDLDLVSLGSYTSVYYNDGSGDFDTVFGFSRGYSGLVPAVADADGDGDMDIVYSVNGTMTVLRNSVVTAPSSNPTSIVHSTNQGTSLGFSMNGGFGTKALVLMKEGSAVDATPTDDVIYTANSTFGSGSEIGTGNYVVYDGTGTSFTVNGLSPNTSYHVEVFQFNAAGPIAKYQTGDITITSATTRLKPSDIISDLSASAVLSSITLEWSASGSNIGQNRIVLAKLGSAVDATPSDSTSLTADTDFGMGTELGTGNFVMYDGSGTSLQLTGLTADTTYHFAIFEYDGSNGTQRYYTAESAITNASTSPAPSIWSKNDSTVVFTKADNADWTQAANQDRITDNFWLTRQDNRGLFNILNEFEYDGDFSPSGTRWGFGTTANIDTIAFKTWPDLHDGSPPDLVGEDMVVYSIADNLVFDINFSSWTESDGGGGFSYTRSKGPEPTPIMKTFQDSAGFALRFDDENLYERYVEVYDSDFLLGNAFTIESWVKLDSLGIIHGIMSLRDEVGFGVTDDNKVYAYHNQPEASSGGGEGEGPCCEFSAPEPTFGPMLLDYDGPSGTVDLISPDTLEQDQWYHIAVTGESGGFLKLYINGVEQDSDSVQNVAVDESYWYFGRERDRGEYLYGFMDEVRIWKTARTESQIRSYMHRPYSGNIGRLYGYWQFNEGTGTSTFDGVNNREAEFYDDNEDAWFISDAPLGNGTATEVENFQTGSQSVGNATLSMADGFDNPVDIQVTEVTADPNIFPTGFTSGVGGKYFVINLFGDPGTFSANLSLNYGAGVLTSSNPAEYKLFKRGSNSTGAWTEVASAASSVNTGSGEVTWSGITSFSQFMGILDEIEYDIQISDGTDVVAFIDSSFIFGSDFFDLTGNFADSTLTVTLKDEIGGALFIDINANNTFDSGTDSEITTSVSQVYTPTSANKLVYEPSDFDASTATIKLTFGDVADSVSLDFFSVEGDPTFAGNTGENGWYLLTNPFTTTLGDLLDQIWTQGAINSNAPNGDNTIYTFNQDSSRYIAVTTDLDTTKIAAGEGLLVYMFEDDDLGDGQSDIDGGWPKTLNNYGDVFGLNLSVPVKNADNDGVSGTSGSEGFVLFGNPYGWSISADSVIATLKRSDELANSYVYRWNPTAKTYQLISTGAINPYESVFLRVVSSGTETSLDFDYDDKYVASGSKRVAEKLFTFTLSQNEYTIQSTLALRFDEKASTTIDPYDGYYLGSFANRFTNLYTAIGDQQLTINNLPLSFDGEQVYPIYLHSTETGTFRLGWENQTLPEGIELSLENRLTGETLDLTEESSMEFSVGSKFKSVSGNNAALTYGKSKQAIEPIFILRAKGNAVNNEDDLGIPREVELYQNYPNPFNPSSVIRYGVPEQARVQLQVFDVLGRKVMTLIDGDMKQPGRYNISFNARDLASGMYIYRLVIGDKVLTKKMTLIK